MTGNRRQIRPRNRRPNRKALPDATLFALTELPCNPTWTSAAIQYGVNDGTTIFKLVVNCVRKAFRQHAVVAANDSVNSGVKHQRIDVRHERTAEVTSQARVFAFVERCACVKIVKRGLENSDFQG